MPRSLHYDLRSRVLLAVDEGLSCREAAARFGVSASSAIRWAALRRAGGDGRAKPQGGDRLSRRTEAHAGLIAAALADVPDITLLDTSTTFAATTCSLATSSSRPKAPATPRSTPAPVGTIQRSA